MTSSALRPARLPARWPPAAGIVFAAGLVVALWFSFAGTAEAGRVLTAAGFVYLGAAALGRRAAAWPLFGVTFVLIGFGFVVPAFDPAPVMLALGAALIIYGLIRGRRRPSWGLPLQVTALLVISVVWVAAAMLPQPWAGLIVGAGLLAHAGWDIHHHRTRRVVTLSLAEFCAALDITLGLAVIGLAVTGLAVTA